MATVTDTTAGEVGRKLPSFELLEAGR